MERCWGLYYGRDGQDALQTSSPLHLGAQLSGLACEAVRGLDQKKLRTKRWRWKSWTPSNPAPASPGKHKFESTNFLGILLLTDCVARTTETMAQHIIRRETELKRLQEVSLETTLSDNLRCMLLMIFSGLDAKEQQSGVLGSVNTKYNYKKVTHALKMQFPNLIQRLVVRRDYLEAARGGGGLYNMVQRGRGRDIEERSRFFRLRLMMNKKPMRLRMTRPSRLRLMTMAMTVTMSMKTTAMPM